MTLKCLNLCTCYDLLILSTEQISRLLLIVCCIKNTTFIYYKYTTFIVQYYIFFFSLNNFLLFILRLSLFLFKLVFHVL